MLQHALACDALQQSAVCACCSFKRAGQPGPLTRLLSCSEERLATYGGLDLMPTFVAPNMEYNADLDDHYAPYNKPSAIAAWLRVRGCSPHGGPRGGLLAPPCFAGTNAACFT